MNEGSSLLPATCDTFIKTLEECMKLSSNLACTDQTINNISKPTIPPVVRSNSGEKKT